MITAQATTLMPSKIANSSSSESVMRGENILDRERWREHAEISLSNEVYLITLLRLFGFAD